MQTRSRTFRLLILAAALAAGPLPALLVQPAAIAQECPNGNCPKQ